MKKIIDSFLNVRMLKLSKSKILKNIKSRTSVNSNDTSDLNNDDGELKLKFVKN